MLISPCAPEYHLPLSASELASALRQGLGRARMHADRHGLRGHEEAVVSCCLADPSYDTQSESRRPGWWLDVAAIAGVVPRLLVELEAPMPRTHLRLWDLNWRIEVAAELARRGHRRGVDLVLALCGPLDEGCDVMGAEEAIELAAGEGLVTLAERIGDALLDDPTCPYGRDILRIYDQRFGDGEASRVLRAQATPAVERFLVEVPQDASEDRPAVSHRDPEGLDACQFLAEFDARPTPKPRTWCLLWGKAASPGDRAVVLDRLFGETEMSALLALCTCFIRQGFPRFDARLIGLLEHENAEARRLAWMGCCTLPHREIRDLIDAAIQTNSLQAAMVDAMRANWRDADAPILIRALRETVDADDRHAFGQAIVDVAPHLTADLTNVLAWVYATTACTWCRRHAVQDLLRRAGLPASIRQEIECDSCEDIRALVRSQKSV